MEVLRTCAGALQLTLWRMAQLHFGLYKKTVRPCLCPPRCRRKPPMDKTWYCLSLVLVHMLDPILARGQYHETSCQLLRLAHLGNNASVGSSVR